MTSKSMFICGILLVIQLSVSAFAEGAESALGDAEMKAPDELPADGPEMELELPSGTNSVDEVKKGLPFRISAMTTVGDKVYLGLIDDETGRTLFLKKGECTWSGFEFLSVEAERGRALFRKNGEVYSGSIRGSGIVRRTLKEYKREDEDEDEEMESAAELIVETLPEPIVLVLDSNTNERVTVNYGGRNSAGAELAIDGKRYAMPRSIVFGLLKSDFMADSMKAQALKSFPGLVEIEEGEDVNAALKRGGGGFPQIPPPPKMALDKLPPKHE